MIDFSEHHRRAQMPLNLVFRLAEEVQQGRHMYQSSESPQRWATSLVGQWNGSPQQPSADVDACLIESVLKGKTDAFGDLVAPHLLSLTRFARMRLRSDVELEDAVQQAVL